MGYTDERLNEQIAQTMGFHPGTAEVGATMGDLRAQFITLAEQVNETCPPGRAKALALTHLEDALMRAIQALAMTCPLE